MAENPESKAKDRAFRDRNLAGINVRVHAGGRSIFFNRARTPAALLLLEPEPDSF
ncbi:MAG: hypothetical protein OXI87_05770 [Albidovulum sp.]|nr:hypothetical protein [Albidovulum sp.]MDE0534036.1 hypothetical protein [Albidovulum sp.]